MAEIEEESTEDYSMRLSGMVQHLATLGETVAETKVVDKFLRNIPHKYKQIVVVILLGNRICRSPLPYAAAYHNHI
jgi:hypothetical protein